MVHSEGFSSSNPSIEPPSVDLLAILSRLDPINTDGMYVLSAFVFSFETVIDFYESLKPLAAFGPTFQRVVSISGDCREAVAEIFTNSTEKKLVKIPFQTFHPDLNAF
jgi:hypothetical protein